MMSVEEVLCELGNGDDASEQGLPPGFRFHPTDEELVTFYLASKVFNAAFSGAVQIPKVDLNKCEPWELPDGAKMGEKEWYFFSLRDRKYPTGLRTNRATGAGYWKATGKDRQVYSASTGGLLGMKKTLVFYKGRAPRGEKTKWVMHEYRLDDDFSSFRHTCNKEEWVICRIFHKNGEKLKDVVVHAQGQGYHDHMLMDSSSPQNSSSLPPLLETPPPPQPPQSITLPEYCQPPAVDQSVKENPFLIDENYDLESLIVNPLLLSQFQNFSPQNCCNPTAISSSSAKSPSMLFKSLLSNHHFTSEELPSTIPKQCKTEPNFSHFQLPAVDANLSCWFQASHSRNPLFLDMGCNVLGFSTVHTHDTSTSPTSTALINRADFQMMLDPPPIWRHHHLPAESWPSDH